MQIKYIRIVCWNRFAFVKLCKYLLKSNKPDEPYNGAFITLYLQMIQWDPENCGM